MSDTHVIKMRCNWEHGYPEGHGMMIGGAGETEYGIPLELGGAPGRTNPEEMLLGAVMACNAITYAALAARRGLEVTGYSMAGEIDIVTQPGGSLKVSAIRLMPEITIHGDDAALALAGDLTSKAEQLCMISCAVRGNVEVTVHPEITRDS